MDVPETPRKRPQLPLVASKELVGVERTYDLAVRVVEGHASLTGNEHRALLANLLADYEETRRVFRGVANENAALKKRLAEQPESRSSDSLVPGLEHAYELINDALKAQA